MGRVIGLSKICVSLVPILLMSSANAKDNILFVDIVSELKSKLLGKAGVRKEHMIESVETICRTRGIKVPCGSSSEVKSLPLIPIESSKDEPSPMCYEPFCRDVVKKTSVVFVEPLVAISYDIVKVTDMVVRGADVVQFPVKTFVKQVEKVNCSSVAESGIDESFSYTSQSTVSTSISRGVQSSVSINVSVSYKLPAGFGSSLGGSVSQTTSLNRSEAQSSTQTINQSVHVSEKIPRRTRTRIDMIFFETSLEVPFEGAIIVDGAVDPNLDDVKKISQVLSLDERTLPVSGALAVTASTKSTSKRFDSPVSEQECQDIINGDSPAYKVQSFEYMGQGPNVLSSERNLPKGKNVSAIKVSDAFLKVPFGGNAGNICYIGSCSRPLNGYREYCYFDDDGGCTSCLDEQDPICESEDESGFRGRVGKNKQ
jgi:hypothetical protein